MAKGGWWMETGRVALILFYGIFWAASLNAAGWLRAFDTHAFFCGKTRRSAIQRFVVALIIINLCPGAWLWFLCVCIVPSEPGALPIMSAALASLSVFWFHRILHAIIATKKFHTKFYLEEEWKEVIDQWRKDTPNTFKPHFFYQELVIW